MPKKKLNVDISGIYNSKCPLFICKELDSLTLVLNVTDGSEPLDLTNATFEVYGLRADGERPKQTVDITLSDRGLTIQLNNSFNCVRGVNFIELEVTKDEEVFTSPSIPFYVEPRLRSDLSFEASTVEQIQGANAEAEKHLLELGKSIQMAIEKFNNLNHAISLSTTSTQTLDTLVKEANQEVIDLDNKYQEVKSWADDFDYDQSIPTIKEDIDYLKKKPTTIQVY